MKPFFRLFFVVGVLSLVFGGYFTDPECNNRTEYISRGRYLFTCLYDEVESIQLAFMSKRCHCKKGLYKLHGTCVDPYICMIACQGSQIAHPSGKRCFCATSPKSVLNSHFCAWDLNIDERIGIDEWKVYADEDP